MLIRRSALTLLLHYFANILTESSFAAIVSFRLQLGSRPCSTRCAGLAEAARLVKTRWNKLAYAQCR